MNMTHLQSILAPWLAPIAPAVLFGNNLHAGMIADQVNPVLAAAAAVLGTVGQVVIFNFLVRTAKLF